MSINIAYRPWTYLVSESYFHLQLIKVIDVTITETIET